MKTWLQRTGTLLATTLVMGLAQAQVDKPIKILVGFPPGGSADMAARLVGERMSAELKQPVIIENKPGAGGRIAAEALKNAAADGSTLLLTPVVVPVLAPLVFSKLPYNPMTDLVPIVQIADVPNVLVVNPTVPAKSMEEFLAYAKANDGKLNYGSTGVGTSSHLSSFMLGKRAGFTATHIPYKGADALKDLLAGRIQFMFATIPSVMPQIQAGKLRPLAVSSLKRSRSMPDISTVIETGLPNFEAGSWFGFFAPKGTPEVVIATLNKAVNEILSSPALEQQMIAQGADPAGGTPGQFGQFVQRETDKWRVIVKESGAKAE